jgi:hypothetical protein
MRIAMTCSVLVSSLLASVAWTQNAPSGTALELAMSDETAQLRYIDPEEIAGQDDGELAYTLFLSEDRDVVGSAAAMVGTNLSIGEFDIRVGPQAYVGLLSEENNDVFALSFGVDARLSLARNRGIAIAGSAFWSPDVLTFGSADNLTDFMARAEAQLTNRLLGFAGYRWFELDLLDRQERKLQNEIFAGVRWQLR